MKCYSNHPLDFISRNSRPPTFTFYFEDCEYDDDDDDNVDDGTNEVVMENMPEANCIHFSFRLTSSQSPTVSKRESSTIQGWDDSGILSQ